jgi:hypothetical protein
MTRARFEELRFYQLAVTLLKAAYKLAEGLPGYEKYNLASQLRRAVLWNSPLMTLHSWILAKFILRQAQDEFCGSELQSPLEITLSLSKGDFSLYKSTEFPTPHSPTPQPGEQT